MTKASENADRTVRPRARITLPVWHSGYLSAFLFLIVILFVTVPSGFNYNDSGVSQDLYTGSWVRRFQWLPILLLAAYALWRRRSSAWIFVSRVNPFLIGFLGLMLMSVLWSPEPAITLRRIVFMVGVIASGMTIFVTGWYPDRMVRLLYIAVGVLLLACAVAAIVFPAFGVHQSGDFTGLWRGITDNKNSLANLADVGVLLGLHAWLVRTVRRSWAGLYLALAVMNLLMSGAKGSLIATCLASMLMVALVVRPVTNRYWLPAVCIITLLAIAIPLFFYSIVYGVPTYAEVFGPFFRFLGKDVTLTGRNTIWLWLLPIIAQHWLFGYGFGAFWLGDYGLSGEITKSLEFYPYQAHNSFLEILNELGVVGLALFFGFLIFHLIQLMRLRQFDRASYCLFLPLLVMLLIISISESAIFVTPNLFTLALVYSSFAMTRYYLDAAIKSSAPASVK